MSCSGNLLQSGQMEADDCFSLSTSLSTIGYPPTPLKVYDFFSPFYLLSSFVSLNGLGFSSDAG